MSKSKAGAASPEMNIAIDVEKQEWWWRDSETMRNFWKRFNNNEGDSEDYDYDYDYQFYDNERNIEENSRTCRTQRLCRMTTTMRGEFEYDEIT